MTKPLVTRANLLLLMGLVAILAVVGGVTWERMGAARDAREWSRHSYEVLAAVQDLSIAVRDMERGQRGYLLTGSEDHLVPYEDARRRLPGLQERLERLTADNAAAQDHLRDLAGLLGHKMDELAQTIAARRRNDPEGALLIVRSNAGRDLMVQIEATLTAMRDDEQVLLAAREAQSARRGSWVRALATIGTTAAILGLLWAARLLNTALTLSRSIEAEQRSVAIRLRASLDSLSQGVAVFDKHRALTNWNETFGALLGIPRAALRIGTAYAEIASALATQGEDLLETDATVRDTHQDPDRPVTLEGTSRDGRHLELRRTGMPGGGFVLTATDMTERVRAEAVLRDAQKMQAIGQLTGGLAHDFNNLLTVILGNLEVLRSKLGREHPLQSRIDRGVWAAERGATLTRQLLAFARKQPLAPTPIDLGAVIPELVPLLRRTLGETTDVRYAAASDLWPAMADAAQVESAVLNLALNARDAMPGGGRLTIALANAVLTEADRAWAPDVIPGDYTAIAVSDTGGGMTPEVVARAFEPFFTTKPDGKGTGLGLAMVFGFVKQSGGHIRIESQPGQGTTMRMYLPRAEAAAPGQRRDSQPAVLPHGSATVLVVEDDPAVREIACAILTDLSYRVIEAADGEEGQRAFEASPAAIDLLLTDVVLPGPMRGRELADRVVALRPDVRVLFMSGHTDEAMIREGRLDPGASSIAKPFHREQLAQKVAEVLGRSAAPPQGARVVPLRSRAEP